jgi:hypothetical protein
MQLVFKQEHLHMNDLVKILKKHYYDPVSNENMVTQLNIKLDNVELSEPNVFILDFAEYKLNNDDWSPRSEVLKIDNFIRDRLQLPLKGSRIKQPWTISTAERAPKARATLRFSFESEYTIPEPTQLAIEDVDTVDIKLNGVKITNQAATGGRTWWVDEDIHTISLPGKSVKKGTNTLILSFPFGVLTNIERIYLLGNFSVSLQGSTTVLQPINLKALTWGDITTQGLPFYAGNVTYNCSFSLPSKEFANPITLSIPEFSTPVIKVTNITTKERLGLVALQPNTLNLGSLGGGAHKIAITAFGNRYNSFGNFHIPFLHESCDPNSWRSESKVQAVFHSTGACLLIFCSGW